MSRLCRVPANCRRRWRVNPEIIPNAVLRVIMSDDSSGVHKQAPQPLSDRLAAELMMAASPVLCPNCGYATGKCLFRVLTDMGMQLSCDCGWWTLILPANRNPPARAKYRRHWPDGR